MNGEQEVFMKAIDKAGLFNKTSRVIRVVDPNSPIEIVSPKNGEILLDDEINMKWSVDEYFPLEYQNLKIDSEEITIGLLDRGKRLDLADGSHQIELTCWDPKDCSFTKKADFIVDTIPPEIDIRAPSDGAVYSNILVNLQWSIFDVNGLTSIRYRLDEKDWVEIDDLNEFSGKEMMDQGGHRLEVEATDIAGRVSSESVNFTIGSGTLEITDPEDGHVTGDENVLIRWSVMEGFIPTKVELDYIEEGTNLSVIGINEHRVQLPSNGMHRFKITAEDIYGNRAADMVTIYRDMDPPFIEILNTEEAVNDQPFILQWAGRDTYGIKGYSYKLDGRDWIYLGNSTFLELGELSEGGHTFEVRCIDNGGNTATDQYEFLYDTTPPEVGFIREEETLILQDPFVSLTWSASDVNGFSEVSFFTGEREYKLSKTKTFWEGILDDGSIEMVISVTDTAGNEANDSMVVIVDTIDPILEWTDNLTSPTNLENIPIGWTTTDNLEIIQVILFEDEDEIWSGSEGGKGAMVLVPGEGSHSYNLKATDLSGRSASIERTFVVDRTAPVINQFDQTYNNDILLVECSVFDDLTSIFKVVISIGNDTHESALTDFSWGFKGLKPGLHTIQILVVDEAGNSIEESKEIEIGSSSDKDGVNDGRSIWILILVSMLIVIVVTSFIIFFIFRKRKMKEEVEKIPEDPLERRISLPPRPKT